MLQTVKQRIINAIPPTLLFVVLYFSIFFICGFQDAIIGIVLSLEFIRLKTDEFVETTIIKSTFIYLMSAAFAYVGGINVY